MCLLSISLLGFTVWCIFYVKKDDKKSMTISPPISAYPDYMFSNQQRATNQVSLKSLSHCFKTWIIKKLKSINCRLIMAPINRPTRQDLHNLATITTGSDLSSRSVYYSRFFQIYKIEQKVIILFWSRGMWRMEMEITWARATFTLLKWDWQIIEVQVMADFQEQRQSEQMKTGKQKITRKF